jgi:hypothetical protein
MELRNRINATRWPERVTVTDDSQGVQLATMQKLASYWANEFDWRMVESKLTLNSSVTVLCVKKVDLVGRQFQRRDAENAETQRLHESEVQLFFPSLSLTVFFLTPLDS